MKLEVTHRTRYRFSKPLTDAIQLLRLTPLSCLSQTVLDWRIDVDCDARLRGGYDGYGNCVHMLYVNQPVSGLAITATGVVITEDRAGVVQGLPGDLPAAVFLRTTDLTAPDGGVREFAADLAGRETDTLPLLHELNRALHKAMVFDNAATDSATPAATAFATRRGVCQDFAHIFIGAARSLGVPARYISGYLHVRDGSGANASHAWAEAWVPNLGWVAFDPANGICADDAYVRIAAGLDYRDAAPLAGARRGGGTEELAIEVRIAEAPRRGQGQSQGNGSQSQWQG